MQGVADAPVGTVTCGYLVVREDRLDPESRLLRLAVARIPAQGDDPRPDPVLYLHGGPGGSATEYWDGWLDDPFLEHRELILLDQRGTGHSKPALCPELGVEDYRILAEDLAPELEMRRRVETAWDCRNRLAEAGFDLGSYNSDASAQDVAELRGVLGFEEWNLLGISYGTKLSLTTMRDAPEGIRSVVLDSVYPPGIPGNVQFREWERAFGTLVDGCAADAACAAAHPDLAAELLATLKALEAEPLEVPVADRDAVPSGSYFMNAQDLVIGVHQGLYDRRVIPLLPHLIDLARDRDAEVLTALVDGAAQRAGGINRAVYHTVECYERGPFMLPPEPGRRFPGIRPHMVFFDIDRQVCAGWWDVQAGPEEARPVKSDLPVLVLAGEYDPITPPAWGRLAAETLPNSRFLEFPGAGHAALGSGACAEGILVAFLDDPTGPLDTDCIAAMPAPEFVTDIVRKPGIYRLSKALVIDPNRGVRFALGLVVLGLVVGALGWPLAGATRERRGTPTPQPSDRRARALFCVASLLAFAFLAGLFTMLAQVAARNPFLLGFGIPPAWTPLFWLPIGVGLVSLLGCVVLVPAWSGARPPARVLHLMALFGCVGFLLFLKGFGLL
jgi:pimeloyl-ACP methyl ester carboxylesterase